MSNVIPGPGYGPPREAAVKTETVEPGSAGGLTNHVQQLHIVTQDNQGYGANDDVLAKEIGDLLGVIDALPIDGLQVAATRKNKIAKAKRVKGEITYQQQLTEKSGG